MNSNRRFVKDVLESGLELGCITADHILAHITPEILAHHLPVAVKARLLQASLEAERMTPALVVEVVGVDALVEHSPLSALWGCVRGAVEEQLGALGGVEVGAAPVEVPASKPPRSARATPHRGSSRVSSLSPRSRAMRARDDDRRRNGESGPSADFELVDETDVLSGAGRSQSAEEETRPGPKN